MFHMERRSRNTLIIINHMTTENVNRSVQTEDDNSKTKGGMTLDKWLLSSVCNLFLLMHSCQQLCSRRLFENKGMDEVNG